MLPPPPLPPPADSLRLTAPPTLPSSSLYEDPADDDDDNEEEDDVTATIMPLDELTDSMSVPSSTDERGHDTPCDGDDDDMDNDDAANGPASRIIAIHSGLGDADDDDDDGDESDESDIVDRVVGVGSWGSMESSPYTLTDAMLPFNPCPTLHLVLVVLPLKGYWSEVAIIWTPSTRRLTDGPMTG